MGKTTKSKTEYTVEETVERFLKLKVVRGILKDKITSSNNKTELISFFSVFPYTQCYDQICKNVAYFIKYDLTDFHSRLLRLRAVNKNSKEWFSIQMGNAGHDIFTSKYGIDVLRSKTPGYGISKAGLVFFRKIDQLLVELQIDARALYGEPGGDRHEFRIRDNMGKWYSYDYTVKELKLIIEFHGEHCHPNKEMSTESWAQWRNRFTKESAEVTYSKDQYKQRLAEGTGFKYVTVWFSEPDESKIERVRSAMLGIDPLPYIPKSKRVFILTYPDGSEVRSKNTLEFRKHLDIPYHMAQDMVHGRKTSFKGYTMRKEYELI